MQLSDVVIVYFVIGAVMVGGGAMTLDDAGIATFFVEEDDDSGQIEATNNASAQVQETGGSITTVVSLAVGGIVLVWELALGLFNFLHWPIIALNQHNAPPMAVLLLGGSFTAAFYLAIVGLLWRAT